MVDEYKFSERHGGYVSKVTGRTFRDITEMRPELNGEAAWHLSKQDYLKVEEQIIKLMLAAHTQERVIAWLCMISIPTAVLSVLHLVLCK